MESTPEEREMAFRIRQKTGKSLAICLFCLRYKHGNFKKALAFCAGEESSEGDRQKAA